MSETIQKLFAKGYEARKLHQFPESRDAFLEAVRDAATDGDRALLAEALCGLAQAERDFDNLKASAHHYHNAVVLYRQLEQPERLAYALRHEAEVLREDGKSAEAEELFKEAETIYRGFGDKAALDLANTLRGLALVNEAEGRKDGARKFWREARELYAKCRVEAGVAECDRKLSQ